MKKSIKKAALTTLSAVAILSTLPSAFCAPGGENKNVNVKGHMDPFHIMIVGKYFNSVEDFKNLEMVNKKYEMTMEKYCLNPVEIDSKEVLSFFPSMETCRVEKLKEENFISKFPNEEIKTMIYLPNSFDSSQFRKVLRDNWIIDADGNLNDRWNRTFELNNENPLDGCKVTFTDGEETIIFVFDPCAEGTIFNGALDKYNKLLSECGVEEAATVNVSGEFTIPNFITSIEEYAFQGFENLTKVNIPNSVTSIEEGAFNSCKNLKNVTIPSSVRSIGKCAFAVCESLTNITIPNSVTSIGEFAFTGCRNLNNVEIPDSVTSIGEWAFVACENLRNITIPSSVTSIGEDAFYGCGNLTNVVISGCDVSIEKEAFNDCKNLHTVVIQGSVNSIGKNAFNKCGNLNHIEFNGNVYDSVDSFMQAFNDYKASQQ